MERHGSLRDSVERARHYGAVARDALGVFADGPEKRALTDLIYFAINRVY
jgi:octaprenyl-diphosphate synthase